MTTVYFNLTLYTVTHMAKFKPKILNGSDLAGFIKARQARQVQQLPLTPRLCIVQTKEDPVIDTYVRLKQEYGQDIGIDVEHFMVDQSKVINVIDELNQNNDVHGIIVQLPLDDPIETDTVVNTVDANKDVDALTQDTGFTSATATAISWLLAGYNIELRGQKIAVIGQGRLVGAPLSDLLESSGLDVVRCDISTNNLAEIVTSADIVISGTGQPELIKNDWVTSETVVVDAGTAGVNGAVVGDLEPAVYDRNDIKITPKKGGVGPLTVCALFENVIDATTVFTQEYL